MIVETNHPTFGPTRLTTTPIKMRGSKANQSCAPKLAPHTREVLRDLLGYHDQQIDALMESGAGMKRRTLKREDPSADGATIRSPARPE